VCLSVRNEQHDSHWKDYHKISCFLFFFFYWRYNPLWALAFSAILSHSAFSVHNFLHPLIPILCISSSASSIHHFVGLPLILLPIGFHSNILLGVLFSSIHITQPNQAILLRFINLNMSAFSISSFSSWFTLILQHPSSFYTGPKISLNIPRSNILRYCSSRAKI
jgi:hypothetical protein